MEKYVSQLIEDIIAAKNNVPQEIAATVSSENTDPLAYIAEWENEQTPQMFELFGLEKVQFPPAERLSKGQLQALIDAMLDLWAAFNFYPEKHENLPLELYYTVIVNSLDEYYGYETGEPNLIDFCSYNYELCQLGEFCHCLEFKDEWQKEDEEWNNKSEAEQIAFVEDFKRRVAENQRRLFENGFDLGREKGKDDEDVF